jgi:hypothetical protein
MKRIFLAMTLMAIAVGANAQLTNNSNSASGANSGSNSTAIGGINTAIGGGSSTSTSGATSGSLSSSLGVGGAGGSGGSNNLSINSAAIPSSYNYSYGTQRIETTPSFGLGAFSNSFSSDYCSGVTQAALSFTGFGFGGGTPTPDETCRTLRSVERTGQLAEAYSHAAEAAKAGGDMETAHADAAMSMRLGQAAINLLCGISDKNAAAYKAAGVPCAGEAPAPAPAVAVAPAASPAAPVEYTDPIIRARLGMPPLEKKIGG